MKYSSETLDIIAQMYSSGANYIEMETATGINREKIGHICAYLAEHGIVSVQGRIARIVELREPIKAMFLKGYTRQEVAIALDITPACVTKYYTALIADGSIKPVGKSKSVRPGHFIKAKPTLKPGETIKCSSTVSRKCVYGAVNTSDGLCRYILVTGEMRRCDCSACDKFSRISRDNPRIITP